MPFTTEHQVQSRPGHSHHHRRTKPDLNINTYDANARSQPDSYAHSPDYENDDYAGQLSTPLSPPPPGQTALPRPPAIPYKSSHRSLLNSPASATVATFDGRQLSLPSQGGQLANVRPATSSAADDSSRYKINSKNNDDSDRVTAQRLRADQWRDARRRSPPRDTDRDLADESTDDQTFFDAFSDTFSDVDMPNNDNDLPPDRHGSDSPPPAAPHLRDSHDLSLSPRDVTRDSLLGNMLLSLDQFNMGQVNSMQTVGETRTMSGFAGPHPSYRYEEVGGAGSRAATLGGGASRTMTSTTSRTRTATRPGSGGRSRGHGYSYSSDYDGGDNLSRSSTNLSPSRRRSNSLSVDIPPSSAGMRGIATNHRPSRGAPSRALHSRGGRTSKSSSTNSIDAAGYAHVLGSQKWSHGIGIPKRSSSLELARSRRSYGTQPPEQQSHLQLHLQQQQQQQQGGPAQPWHIELPSSFFNHSNTNFGYDYDYDLDDAAPTPTVPAGPRRLANMPSMPSFARHEPMAEPLSPVRSVNINLERKRSNKSAHSTNTARHRSSSRRDAALGREDDPLPPLPVTVPVPDVADSAEDSAPAPHVGYGKAKEPVHTPNAATPTSAVSQSKDKQPGFFRRMFGGGSKNGVVAALDQSVRSPSTSVAPASSLNSPAAAAVDTMSSTNSSQLPHAPPSDHNKTAGHPSSRQADSSQALQKKPSGFFRRRKKSLSSNNAGPPPLPPTLPPPIIPPAELGPVPPKPRLEVMTPIHLQPSPVTSLRKAMDPYLKTSESTPPSSARGKPRDDFTLSIYHSAVGAFNSTGDRQPRSFSPDYKPDPRATIRSVRSVKSESKTRVRVERSPSPGMQRPGTPPRHVSKPLYDYERSGSFLHDNSESDGSPQYIRKQASQPVMNGRSRSPHAFGRSTLAPIQTDLSLSSPSSNATIRDKKLDRLTQDSMSTVKSDRPGSLTLPIEGFKTDQNLKTRASAASIPSLTVEDSAANVSTTDTPKSENPLDEPDFVLGEPTEDDRAKARKIFDGNEEFILKSKAASWMGEEGPIRQRTLRAYMDLYDFTNKNIAACLREVCNKLVLRAETQQVDRILVAFSKRWCDCNPNHGFKSEGKYSSWNVFLGWR